MKFTFSLIVGFLSQFCFGQDTIFLDAKWAPTDRTDAKFFRIDKKEGNKWNRTDYYFETKQIQMKGAFSSISPEVKDGHFEWYHSNGKLKHIGNYEKDQEVGEHLWYGENGNLEARENYKNGQLNGSYEEYYPNGKLTDKTEFIDGVQNGWTLYYRQDGSLQSEGNFKNGNRNGEWKFYDETGKLAGTNIFKIDYEIKEAKINLQLPNDEWSLASYSDSGLTEYIFKRNEIQDSLGKNIIPAIMVYVEDAKEYNQDLILYSLAKREKFKKTEINFSKILTPSDKDFPFAYKNAMIMLGSYSDEGIDHVFYMIYIITKEGKGVQIYMDMTKSIADKYEQEFWVTLKSIK